MEIVLVDKECCSKLWLIFLTPFNKQVQIKLGFIVSLFLFFSVLSHSQLWSLRNYSLLYTHCDNYYGNLGQKYRVLGIDFGLATGKASNLPMILFLQPSSQLVHQILLVICFIMFTSNNFGFYEEIVSLNLDWCANLHVLTLLKED